MGYICCMRTFVEEHVLYITLLYITNKCMDLTDDRKRRSEHVRDQQSVLFVVTECCVSEAYAYLADNIVTKPALAAVSTSCVRMSRL